MNTQNVSSLRDVKGVVAVDQHVPTAGAIIWWRLSGRVDYNVLRAAWAAAGLDDKDLLKPCSATVALRRAANDMREKRRLIRPLGRGEGFAVVKERLTSEKTELEHEVIMKVILDPVGRPQFEHFGAVGSPSEESYKLSGEIRAAFDTHLNELECEDFSNWLVRLMPRLDAVGLRDTGGVYFIPFDSTERLRAVAEVLGKVTSHTINRVPAMRSDDAVAAILDAIETEALQEASVMERELEASKLGERGYENRISRCTEVEDKVSRYEELLGKKLDTVRERLDALRANLTLAVMKAGGSGVRD